ncbi:MAG: glycine cleavage system protein GcvH [Dehalococcoidia bacterium]|nr:glycine cleavage system protein GcvH [Dehalococcoidia bacterium]
MSKLSEYRYAKTHEWVRIDDGAAVVGISAHAAEQLGDVVFVEMTAVGAHLKQFDRLGVVESVKAVSDLYSPISGVVTDTNGGLLDRPELVNLSPLDEGWMVKLAPDDLAELENLLTSQKYEETFGEGH